MTERPPADYGDRLEAAAATIAERIDERIDERPAVGLVLGSGLGAFADTLQNAVRIPYAEVPSWPVSTVQGHSGHLVIGTHAGKAVAVMQGRVHLYEGYEPWEVVFPVRVLSLLGCRSLVVTNAAGAINNEFSVGDLMLIRDHINMQGTSACLGTNVEGFGPRFFDMTHAYDPGYRALARRAATHCGLQLREGVYAAMLGPAYETPAEIAMLARLGADAVGMSTVPEVTAARHADMRVIGISCLSNMAAGVLDVPLDHAEVMETGERVRESFIGLVNELVRLIHSEGSD